MNPQQIAQIVRPVAYCYADQPEQYYLGLQNTECPHCGALLWEDEKNSNGKFMQCYKNDAFALALFKEPPSYLKGLYLGRGGEVRQFQACIHRFNAAFAFTSDGCKLDQRLGCSMALRPVSIYGHLYHNIGPLGVAEGATAA
jgi:hypothetical protein